MFKWFKKLFPCLFKEDDFTPKNKVILNVGDIPANVSKHNGIMLGKFNHCVTRKLKDPKARDLVPKIFQDASKIECTIYEDEFSIPEGMTLEGYVLELKKMLRKYEYLLNKHFKDMVKLNFDGS